MQQNILILWLWAFGFAIAKHLWENNPDQVFYASEVNAEIFENIQNTREHPYFFKWVTLPENIHLIHQTLPWIPSLEKRGELQPVSLNKGEDSGESFENNTLQNILPQTDIIISVIPCQFVGNAFTDMKPLLKENVIILNLSKWIDNQSLQTVSEKLTSILNPFSSEEKGVTLQYTYAYLAWGMIAQELVDEKTLGADIVVQSKKNPLDKSRDKAEMIGLYLQKLFQSDSLDINLKIWDVKNTELYAALKNIVALILGYYEGQWAWASTLWYYFSILLREMQGVIKLLTPPPNSLPTREGEMSETNGGGIDFTDYALSGDLIATCFGASRNRQLGVLLGWGMNRDEALTDLASQKRIAEWYETLKWVYKITKGKEGFEEINTFGERYLT